MSSNSPRWASLMVAWALALAGCDGAATVPQTAAPPTTVPPTTEAEAAAPDLVEPEPTTPADPHDPAGDGEPRRAADLPLPRTEVAGAVWEGVIVVVGGLPGTDAVRNVDLYDLSDDIWSRGPDLPMALHHTAVATLGDRVYVVGGYAIEGGRWVPKAEVWSLGPGEEEWRPEPPLSFARGALAVASTGDRIVAVGGFPAFTSTEILHAGADGWVPGPDLRVEREHLAAAAVGDEVYAIAGRAGGFASNRSSVEVLRGDAWEPIAALNFSRGGIGAATIGDIPCLTGGEEEAGTIGSVECLIDDEWVVLAGLEVPRHGLVVVAIGLHLHVIGGGPRPGLTVSGVHEVIPILLP